MKTIVMALLCAVSVLSIAGVVQGEEAMVADGKTVSFDYTLTVDGQQLDTSVGKTPLQYTHGQKMIVPGLEKELTGMKVGEKKTVVVKPEEGYGPVNAEAIREIEKTQLPEGAKLEVGGMLSAQTPSGQAMPVKIVEVKDKTVMIDFNHPLAGKELHFDVTIVSVS